MFDKFTPTEITILVLGSIALITDACREIFGGKSLVVSVLETVVDTYKYTIAEIRGNVYQQINAMLAFAITLSSIVFLSLIVIDFNKNNNISETIVVGLIGSIVALGFTLVICPQFTRHRY